LRKIKQKSKKREPNISITFSEVALAKTLALVMDFDGEVGWHGTVVRDKQTSFTVNDIYVYPQKVSRASINTDQFGYEKWLMTQEDCVFNNLRMHSHSHVNFSVMPSVVDDRHRENIVEKLTGDMFYIFMIWNKRFQYHALVYNRKTRSVHTTNDVNFSVIIGKKRIPFKKLTRSTLEKIIDNAKLDNFLINARGLVETWKGVRNEFE